MAVKIKLKRLGKIREPYYRIVVADARTKRDGRAIEEIGLYHPKAEPSRIEVNSDRVQHWLSVGAQPTDPVRVLLKITGDWQKFTGEPGSEGTLRTAEPRADKKERFAAAAKESQATKEEKGAKESKAGPQSRAAKPAKDAARAKDTAAKGSAAKDASAKGASAKGALPKTAPPRAPPPRAPLPRTARPRTARPRTARPRAPPLRTPLPRAPLPKTARPRPNRTVRTPRPPPARPRKPPNPLTARAHRRPRRRPRLTSRGAEPDVLEEALEHLVRGIVQYPDDVQVASRTLRRGNVLEVRVHPDDLGKVIGRGGRTARALRTVISALAAGRYVRIDLLDANEVR